MGNYEKIVKHWQDKEITTGSQLAMALDHHRIFFAYHSGKIENPGITYTDTREVFEHDGVASYTGDLRTLFEIRNAKIASEYFITCFEQREPLSEKLVKEFQHFLTRGTYDSRRYEIGERPGEYKVHDYVTGRQEVGASAEDVAEEMKELIDELQNVPAHSALTAAAYFHAKFENIHPFADGNGRTGRLVMNYLLVTHDHPPIIVHEEDRVKYYAALETWDETQELDELVNFLQEQTVKTWKKQFKLTQGRSL